MGRKCRTTICLVAIAMLLLLSGCGPGREEPVESQPSEPVPTVVSGSDLMTSGQKLRSVIIDSSTSPAREIIFELYVDGQGDGKGLMGTGEIVKEVLVSGNSLYIKLDDNLIIPVIDITGRMFVSAVNINQLSDVTTSGFTVVNGIVTHYNGSIGTLTIDTQYTVDSGDYPAVNVANINQMGLAAAINYVIDYNGTNPSNTNATQTPDGTGTGNGVVDESVVNFYTESEYGITINGKKYSVGDTCNPSTYFGLTPEGILQSSAYKEDTRVDFTHISYISETGRTQFVTTENYVQSIDTNAEFEWLDFVKGFDQNALYREVGYRLSNAEAEEWKPFDENLKVLGENGGTLYCQVGQLTIHLRFVSGRLDSIYIERRLAFQ